MRKRVFLEKICTTTQAGFALYMMRVLLLFFLCFCLGFTAGPTTGIRNIPNHNLADQGNNVGRSVKNIIDQVDPSRVITLVFAHESGWLDEDTIYYFSTSETIPSNIAVEVEPGAVIDVTDCTLTINGPFVAGLHHCISLHGTGSVVFSNDSVRQKYPEWDSSTPDQYTEFDGGISLGTIANFASTDTDPSVQNGVLFKTNNGSSTTIDDFDDGATGQVIKVIINDTNTTIDFTTSGLRGNGGADWSPTTYDWMECFYDGTDWFCSVHDCSS
jgi:hypothetical protein